MTDSKSADQSRGDVAPSPRAPEAPAPSPQELPASDAVALLRTTLDTSFDAMLLIDAATERVVQVNRRATRLLGHRRDSLEGTSFASLCFRETQSSSWKRRVEALASGDTLVENAMLRQRKGSAVPVELRYGFHPVGASAFVVVAVRERESTSTDRMNDVADLDAILDGIADAVITTDRMGRVMRINQVGEQLTGWTRQRAREQRLDQVMNVQEREGKPIGITDAVLGSGVVMVLGDQARLVPRSGGAVPIEGVAAPIRQGRDVIDGVVVVFRDWTHERRSRDALRRSEQSFRTLIESLPVALWVTRDGRVIYTNPTARTLSGAEASEQPKKTKELLSELVHPSDRERYAEHLASPGERSQPVELRLQSKEGLTHVVELTSLPLSFNGRPALVTVGRDLTERRSIEAQLKLTERMVSLGTLAAGVAHEINNPLAIVLANLQALARQVRAEGDTAQLLEETQQGAERVQRIVADLSSFSRGDDTGDKLVDVRRALESAIAMARNEIRHRAELVVRSTDELLQVRANEARLAQAFLNLLLNAAQALPDGQADKHRITVALRGTGSHVVVDISDTGRGIPASVRERVFDPFFTTREVGEGMGLGLTVSHSIINGLSGNIGFESGDRGTTFSVTLPLSRSLAPPAPGQRESVAQRRARILVIDDELMVTKALKRLLRHHDLRTVGSGREAIELIDQDAAAFDVVICDMMMPDMSGSEVYARLKETTPELADRMLFMTGGAFTPGARSFLDRMQGRWFEKPFDRAVIDEQIERIFPAS